MYASIGGRWMYLWRAVDSEGEILDLLVQTKRDKRGALKLMRQLLKTQGFAPDAVVTDKLRSYGAALQELGLSDRQVTGGRSNSRAENSHQAVRRQECVSKGIKSTRSARRFLPIQAAVYSHFNVQRHLKSRRALRKIRTAAKEEWHAIAATCNLSEQPLLHLNAFNLTVPFGQL